MKKEQWCDIGTWHFSIDKAQDILDRHPRAPRHLPVRPWVAAYGLSQADPGTVALLGPGPGFNREYAMTTDITRPLIVATLRSGRGGDELLLIDGMHRLYRAWRENVDRLPACLLDFAETTQIREQRYR